MRNIPQRPRSILLTTILMLAAGSGPAAEPPQATGILDGKPIVFAQRTVPVGAKAALALLESCHDESLFAAEELRTAERGDHLRLVFAEPISVTIQGERLPAAEVVLRLPTRTGVFWVRSGEKVRRFAKYEFEHERPFAAWFDEARTAREVPSANRTP